MTAMRCLTLVSALIITACAEEQPAAPGLATGIFTGSGRDALCISGPAGAQRVGFVVYGAENANCSASGRVEQSGAGWKLIPDGDADCKISFNVNAAQISLGAATPNCAYYCGPSASFAGKSFSRTADGKPVTDLAGSPLC